ncbi:MAG: tRNA adenosine(34) deaminase TadA [Streptococcaceae bacterium]|jgi:tRNA(adenine34) deaminase|nr:tRNA adenosine(34) deaminase TadA [Streptococcaceae bacterium]
MTFTEAEKAYYMRQALIEAQKAADHDEVPIGAVVVKDGQIIGRGFNAREAHHKATHHAEICAIDQANEVVGNWRLLECALFVTIEPCVMCSGAISLARLSQVYFGAANPKFGGAVSLYQILQDERLNHRLHVESGILERECADMMQNFFKNRRKQ